jgi:hypothetical protein
VQDDLRLAARGHRPEARDGDHTQKRNDSAHVTNLINLTNLTNLINLINLINPTNLTEPDAT